MTLQQETAPGEERRADAGTGQPAIPPVLARAVTAGGAAYHETGAGPVLVLIHGVGMRLEAWQPQIAAFAGTHRVIAVDMPGHGGSARLAAGADLPVFIRWFGRFLDDLELDRVNVAGHSMGALIAGGAAACFGRRIARVACLNGVYRRDPAAKAAVLARAVAIRENGVDSEGPLRRWFGDDRQSALARDYTGAWLRQVDPEGYAIAYGAFAGGDDTYAGDWPRITCPALFLTGADDPNSTPKMAQAMAASAPDGWAVIIPDQRHMVNLTAPGIVNEAMAEWLAKKEMQG